MNILLSNDDGYEAKGINTLFDVLSKNHNVYMLAPDSNRSAVSHHYSMYVPQKITQVGENKWASSGYPADCVFTGIKSDLLDVKFDLVISGINHGANLGTDIIYSGTCACARQGSLFGYPSVAVSMDVLEWTKEHMAKLDFVPLAEFIGKNIDVLYKLADSIKGCGFVNVNAMEGSSYKGVKFPKRLAVRSYKDYAVVDSKNNREMNLRFMPGGNDVPDLQDTDYDAVQKGYVSISNVLAEPVCGQLVDDNTFSL